MPKLPAPHEFTRGTHPFAPAAEAAEKPTVLHKIVKNRGHYGHDEWDSVTNLSSS